MQAVFRNYIFCESFRLDLLMKFLSFFSAIYVRIFNQHYDKVFFIFVCPNDFLWFSLFTVLKFPYLYVLKNNIKNAMSQFLFYTETLTSVNSF